MIKPSLRGELTVILILSILFVAINGLKSIQYGTEASHAILDVSSYGDAGDFLGSGFLIGDGKVITAAHIIGDGSSLVYVSNEHLGRLSAEILDISFETDLALLEVTSEISPLIKLPLATFDRLETGRRFVSPAGPGIITATDQAITAGQSVISREFSGLLEIEMAVSKGNSGLPILNNALEVIGVILVHAPQEHNIGFAIPVNRVTTFLKEYESAARKN